jgi:NAD-reducing hydrogenase small subunit
MKKKLVTVWLGGCSGCHMSLLDLDERLLEVAKLADIVKSPIVDGKTFTLADIALVEGAISSQEHLEEIKEIRKKSKKLIAFGDCAVTGNVTALRNEVAAADVLKHAYALVPSDDGKGSLPLRLVSPLLPKAVPLHEIV